MVLRFQNPCDYNEKGELLDFALAPGNVADNNHGLLKRILKKTKGKLMTLQERYMLLKRSIIERVNDIFTSVFDLQYFRHRNPDNALTHMISCVCIYCFYLNKPSMNFPNCPN